MGKRAKAGAASSASNRAAKWTPAGTDAESRAEKRVRRCARAPERDGVVPTQRLWSRQGKPRSRRNKEVGNGQWGHTGGVEKRDARERKARERRSRRGKGKDPHGIKAISTTWKLGRTEAGRGGERRPRQCTTHCSAGGTGGASFTATMLREKGASAQEQVQGERIERTDKTTERGERRLGGQKEEAKGGRGGGAEKAAFGRGWQSVSSRRRTAVPRDPWTEAIVCIADLSKDTRRMHLRSPRNRRSRPCGRPALRSQPGVSARTAR